MDILSDVLIAVFAAFGALCAVWCIAGRPIRSVPADGRGRRLCLVVRAEGAAEELERDVRAGEWMKKHGLNDMLIIIADGGMLPEARCAAERLAAETGAMLAGLWEAFGNGEDISGREGAAQRDCQERDIRQ